MTKRGRPVGSKSKKSLEQFAQWDALAKKYGHPFKHLFAIAAGKEKYPVKIGDSVVQMAPTLNERMAASLALLRYRHDMTGNSGAGHGGQFVISWEGDDTSGRTIEGDAQ